MPWNRKTDNPAVVITQEGGGTIINEAESLSEIQEDQEDLGRLSRTLMNHQEKNMYCAKINDLVSRQVVPCEGENKDKRLTLGRSVVLDEMGSRGRSLNHKEVELDSVQERPRPGASVKIKNILGAEETEDQNEQSTGQENIEIKDVESSCSEKTQRKALTFLQKKRLWMYKNKDLVKKINLSESSSYKKKKEGSGQKKFVEPKTESIMELNNEGEEDMYPEALIPGGPTQPSARTGLRSKRKKTVRYYGREWINWCPFVVICCCLDRFG